MLTQARKGSIPPTPSVHRLLPGLQGYLIPFATPAFVHERQLMSRNPPSPRVFFLISTHFTATPRIPVPPPLLQHHSIMRTPEVEPLPFTRDLWCSLRTLYAQ